MDNKRKDDEWFSETSVAGAHERVSAMKTIFSAPINRHNTVESLRDNFSDMFSIDRFNKGRSVKTIVSHEEVGAEARAFAAVIGQAVMDSMPNIIFHARSKEPLFNSEVPDSYDAFDFLSSDRLDLYANIAGIDPECVRTRWRRQYQAWKKEMGEAVVNNIIGHAIKLIAGHKEGTVVYMDAYSFFRSPQFKYWADVIDRNHEELRIEVMDMVIDAVKAARFSDLNAASVVTDTSKKSATKGVSQIDRKAGPAVKEAHRAGIKTQVNVVSIDNQVGKKNKPGNSTLALPGFENEVPMRAGMRG